MRGGMGRCRERWGCAGKERGWGGGGGVGGERGGAPGPVGPEGVTRTPASFPLS